ncbi:alpha/beta fold hydrolase [Dasania marina]|uniref:alpha/beta fold hydrolase n=1 Tax=Dasania marina TaxID=471499 RepID=UPI00035D61F9|nr:alpha/beta hydrolase [Dasania marina]
MNIQPYFEQQGSGPPIVFIHGSFASHAAWKKFVEQLSPQYHCISIKLPGHGDAPAIADHSPATIRTETTLISQIINTLTDQPVQLVGHSYGGVVALALALENTINISKLSLFEPVAGWLLQQAAHTQPEITALNKFLTGYRQAVAEQQIHACGQVIDFWGGQNSYAALPDFIKDTMTPMTSENIRHWDICMNLAYTLQDLQQLTMTTQLIYGDRSNPILHTLAQLIAEAIPNSQLQCIPGASHFLVNSHSAACITALQQTV